MMKSERLFSLVPNDDNELSTIQASLQICIKVLRSWELSMRRKGYPSASAYLALCFTGPEFFMKLTPGYGVEPFRVSINKLDESVLGDSIIEAERFIQSLPEFNVGIRSERIASLKAELAELETGDPDDRAKADTTREEPTILE